MPVVLGRPLDFLLSLIDIAFFMIYCCHEMTAEASPTFPQPAHGTRNGCHRPDPARSEPPRRPDARSHARAAELAREEGHGHAATEAISECSRHGARGVKALLASPERVAAFLAYAVETGTRPSTLGRRVRSATLTKLAGHLVPTDDGACRVARHSRQTAH